MPINTISLITGALSFSAALAWNKAINDGLQKVASIQDASLVQAIIITIIIIITIFIINVGMRCYTKVKKTHLHDTVKKLGKNSNNKINLWAFIR